MSPFDTLRASIGIGGDGDDEKPKIPLFGEIAVLRDALKAFNAEHEFESGMIVRQKPECKIYKTFSDNGIAIVVALLDEPIISTAEDCSSPHWQEPKHMIIGERLPDGKFATYHVDSRRFEPIEETE